MCKMWTATTKNIYLMAQGFVGEKEIYVCVSVTVSLCVCVTVAHI